MPVSREQPDDGGIAPGVEVLAVARGQQRPLLVRGQDGHGHFGEDERLMRAIGENGDLLLVDHPPEQRPQVLVPGHRRARREAVEQVGDVRLDVSSADLGRCCGQVVGRAERSELAGGEQVLLDRARGPGWMHGGGAQS